MSNLTIAVINKEALQTSEKKVSGDLFGLKPSPFLIAQSVRKYLSNQRSAYGKAKTRGEVSGTTAKIWKQKGTGRARHGDRKAPIFMGGGVAHGPTGEQNYHLSLNKKAGRLAVFSLLSEKLKEKKLYLVSDFEFNKTKQAADFIAKVKEKYKQDNKIYLVLFGEKELDRIFGNLSEVEILDAASLNVYDLAKAQFVLMTKKALSEIEKGVTK